jgi:hypothetical protein
MEEIKEKVVNKNATETITFVDGKAVHEKKVHTYTIEYHEKDVVVIWRNYQIRFDATKKHLSIVKLDNDGIATVVAFHNLKTLDGKLYLKPERPCFHQSRFIDWCHEHHIITVRSKVPNRTVGTVGEFFTDGTVTEVTDEFGCKCRIIENATWTIIKYEYENILYTRTSVYKLDLPAEHGWKIA